MDDRPTQIDLSLSRFRRDTVLRNRTSVVFWLVIGCSLAISSLLLGGCNRTGASRSSDLASLDSQADLPSRVGRITGASMAPSFRGEALLTDCPDCRILFSVDANHPPRSTKLTCPNCGYNLIELGECYFLDGEAFQLYARGKNEPLSGLDRWEVFAFTHPEDPEDYTVKRLVALPGEELAIVNGDLFIDGVRLRKTLDQQLQTRIEVFRETGYKFGLLKSKQTDRLDGEQQDKGMPRIESGRGWSFEDQGWKFRVQPDKSAIENVSNAESKLPDQVLRYRHARCAPNLYGQQLTTAIDDNYGFNQGISRNLHPTNDLMIACSLQNHLNSGQIEFHLWDGAAGMRVGLDFNRRVMELESQRLAQEKIVLEWTEQEETRSDSQESVKLLISLFDSQLVLALGGEVVVQLELEDVSGGPAQRLPDVSIEKKVLNGSELPANNSTRNALAELLCPLSPEPEYPLLIASDIEGVQVSELSLYRDIHYLDPQLLGVPWRTQVPHASLGFFLGDNVPVSVDCRQWAQAPERKTSEVWSLKAVQHSKN